MEKKEFIEIVKKEGLEAALSMSAREENINWKCPVCESPVKIEGQEEFETLSEHVSNPNMTSYPKRDAYRCTNKQCICNREEHDVFWSYQGEMYGGFRIDDEDFIGENNAPFGSFERKINLEISKCGVKDKKYLSPAFCLWLLQPYIEYHYKGDVMGNVVKKWFTIEFLKKDKDRGEFCYGFSPCWSTWSYLFREFKSRINTYKENGDIKTLKKTFKTSHNRAWVYVWFENAMKLIYYRYYRLLKK